MPFSKDDPNINREGRPKGSGISITTEIKRKLAEIPEGKDKPYLHYLIEQILKKAVIEGDQQTIKQIWNYIDGLPKQNVEMTGAGGKDLELVVKQVIYGGDNIAAPLPAEDLPASGIESSGLGSEESSTDLAS